MKPSDSGSNDPPNVRAPVSPQERAYRPGMEGVIQRALAGLTAIEQAHRQGTLARLHLAALGALVDRARQEHGGKEIVFAPANRALANKLGTPLAIFNWVRNNVKSHPTYGSIQGADHCRQTLQCNGAETASLLIALLRAKGIAARYVFGTAEVPIAAARNWFAVFDKDKGPVWSALSAGGIATAEGLSGGRATVVRLEHVWVEAWLDYVPLHGSTVPAPVAGRYETHW